MPRFSDPERLDSGHSVGGFDSGRGSLDIWLQRHALAAQGAGSARTHVVTDEEQDGRVIGFHSLTGASISHREATERIKRGMPRYPIPAVLLARLAVDESVQGQGIGAFLLQDAMRRTLSVEEEVGVRLLLVHAMDEEAQAFYRRFGFEVSPTDDLNLQMLVKDIRRTISERQA